MAVLQSFGIFIMRLFSLKANAQYHQFEGHITGGWFGKEGLDGIVMEDFHYSYHFSKGHALGLSLGLNQPFLVGFQQALGYRSTSNYRVQYSYQNPSFLSLSIFYRLYFSQVVYFETSLGKGNFQENFSAIRESRPTENISGINYLRENHFPVIKFAPVLGFHGKGKKTYFSYRLGATILKMNPFPSTYLSVNTNNGANASTSSTYTFKPTSGTYFFLTMGLGIGFKK